MVTDDSPTNHDSDADPTELSLSEGQFDLPPGGEAFLDALADALDPTRLSAVLLFGSVVSAEVSDVSDVDLLVVLEDGADPEYAASLRARCETLAARHLDAAGTPPNRLERAVERATGMFRSGFVTHRRAVVAGRFPAIFNTSQLAYALAPWRTVLFAVFASAEPIAGTPVEPAARDRIDPFTHAYGELARSWVTTASLATAQVPYRVVSGRAVQYSMEAFKWTAYACAIHLEGDSVDELRTALSVIPVGDWYVERFLAARTGSSRGLVLVILTPLLVTTVHVRTLVRLVHRRLSGESVGRGE